MQSSTCKESYSLSLLLTLPCYILSSSEFINIVSFSFNSNAILVNLSITVLLITRVSLPLHYSHSFVWLLIVNISSVLKLHIQADLQLSDSLADIQ